MERDEFFGIKKMGRGDIFWVLWRRWLFEQAACCETMNQKTIKEREGRIFGKCNRKR